MESSTELQKPKLEKEVYNNNKKNVTKGKKMIKSLIGFHSANKIDNYNRGGKIRKRKNSKESKEQIKT